ncbi:serine hydrolase [Streptomyces sp. NPDC057575]|uniref:serine hydrolase n=1 Tax=unclassified Streptomyces TaxID=2593676 RepID=UPI0036C0ECCF
MTAKSNLLSSGRTSTAARLLRRLAAEERVDLDEPVQRYVPGVLPDGYPPIPVRLLLNFTSSLPELTTDDLPTTPEGIVEHRFDDHPLAELARRIDRLGQDRQHLRLHRRHVHHP